MEDTIKRFSQALDAHTVTMHAGLKRIFWVLIACVCLLAAGAALAVRAGDKAEAAASDAKETSRKIEALLCETKETRAAVEETKDAVEEAPTLRVEPETSASPQRVVVVVPPRKEPSKTPDASTPPASPAPSVSIPLNLDEATTTAGP